MKKIKLFVAIAMVLAVGTVQTSCIGKFKLTGKLLNWNRHIDDKFVNELVFLGLAIVQVYTIAVLVDGLILNSIEFWSGSNPVSMNEGEKETKVIEQDGVKYLVTATQNRFDFIQLEGKNKGEAGALVYNPETQTWRYEGDNQSIDLVKLNPDGTALVYLPNGKSYTVENSSNGLATLKSLISSRNFVVER